MRQHRLGFHGGRRECFVHGLLAPLFEILPRKSWEDLLPFALSIRLALSLLPNLLQSGELSHSRHLVTALLKLVLNKTLALEDRGVNCLENKIILWA